MRTKKGERLLKQVKKNRQAKSEQAFTKIVKKKQRRVNFDKVKFNG